MISMDVRRKQRAVIAFLALEEELPINIFNKLERAYGDAVIGCRLLKREYPRLKIKKKV